MKAPLKLSDIKPVYDGPRDSKTIAVKKDSIRLSGDGIFYTCQGEGPTLGYPALFVRLHHCNLTCSFCDAWYTFDRNSKEFWTESIAVTFEALAASIEHLWPANTKERRVVWTGGEPLMQKHQIDEVMSLLWLDRTIPFYHPEVETNGTIMPTNMQLDNYQFNVSPKLHNSGNIFARMFKPKILKVLTQHNSTFKFVCRAEHDLNEIELVYGPWIDHDKIIIMPEGVTEDEISKHAKILKEPCLSRGWRMTPRFQAIFADGAARGV